MNAKNWQIIPVTAVCVAALLAGGHSLTASADDAAAEAAAAEAAAAEAAVDEASLIDVLKSEAGWQEKQAACRGLRQIGTVKSIPALAALLPDEKLSHMARYALEPMPFPEAGQALRDALGGTEALPKAGVIISIGARRDPEAVPLLVPLLNDPNMDVARAAAGALGRIATPEAIDTLRGFQETAPEGMRRALAGGLLAAGQRLTQEGKGELAVPIYEDLLAPDWPMDVRMGAWRGRAYARPEQTSSLVLIAMLGNEPPVFRDMSAQIVAETSGEKSTKFYAEALTKVPVDGQAALLRGLAGRADPIARPAVAQAVHGPDKQVKLAALKALGVLGNGADVATLTGLLASDDTGIADAAKASLGTMQGEDVNPAIAATVPDAAPAVRAQLLELLGNRRAGQAVPLAVKGLKDTDVTVRLAGLRVLALLGGKDQAAAVVVTVAAAADSSERSAAEKALCAICSRCGEEAMPVVLDAMNGADPESRIVLLRGLARIGGPRALEIVLGALNDANEQISAEAVRLLSNWPTLDAVPHLLKLARSDDLSRQVLGLRGYVRLAGIEPSVEKKTHMLTEAMDLANRPEEKKLVLGAWGTVMTEQSLNTLQPYLDDAAVQNEAAWAIIAVAAEVGKKNEESKTRAMDALRAVLEKCEDAEIHKSALRALSRLK